MPFSPDQRFHLSLPLAWSPDHDPIALSEQLQQAENQIRALRLEQISHWMEQNWPAELGYAIFTVQEQRWSAVSSVADHLWRLPAPAGETDEQKKARQANESARRDAYHKTHFAPFLDELVRRLEKAGLPEAVMRSFLQGYKGVGPTFLGREHLQENGHRLIEEWVGPLRRAQALEQSLPESPPPLAHRLLGFEQARCVQARCVVE